MVHGGNQGGGGRGGGGVGNRGVRVAGSVEAHGVRTGSVGEVDVGGLEVGNGAGGVVPGTGRQIRGGGRRGRGGAIVGGRGWTGRAGGRFGRRGITGLGIRGGGGRRGGGGSGNRGVRVGASIEAHGIRTGTDREIDLGGMEVGNGAGEVAPEGSNSTGRQIRGGFRRGRGGARNRVGGDGGEVARARRERKVVEKVVEKSATLLNNFADALLTGNRNLQLNFANQLLQGDIWVTMVDELNSANELVKLHGFDRKLKIPGFIGRASQGMLRNHAVNVLGISADMLVMY